ncbi:MAG: OmpA family protein, partial [Acidimicrobiia bacterium]|nr:OmpA family protein [Acidimicrobiia bacterium]
QDGAVITGCLEKTVIQGSVNGSIAKATGVDPATGETSSFIFVVDSDGSLAGAVAVGNRSFVARTAVPVSETVSDRCGTASGASGVCDAPLYVNFEYDSAVIESESEQLLSDIYRILVDLQIAEIIIEGHTSSEGSEAHNLELSKARAQAVADDLIRRGFPAGAINVVGLGESDLLVAPDNDESARAINRRVEIVCGQADG